MATTTKEKKEKEEGKTSFGSIRLDMTKAGTF